MNSKVIRVTLSMKMLDSSWYDENSILQSLTYRLQLMPLTYKKDSTIVEAWCSAVKITTSEDCADSIINTDGMKKEAIHAMVRDGAIRLTAENKLRELAEENTALRMQLNAMTADLHKNLTIMDRLIDDRERAMKDAFNAGREYPGTYEEWQS